MRNASSRGGGHTTSSYAMWMGSRCVGSCRRGLRLRSSLHRILSPNHDINSSCAHEACGFRRMVPSSLSTGFLHQFLFSACSRNLL